MSRNGLMDLVSGVWVGDYLPKGKLVQKDQFLFDISKEEVRCLDLNRWGWLRLFNTQSIEEKVLAVDSGYIYTERSVFRYTASPERVTCEKVFQHDHDVRSLVVVNEFIFAAYYKTGEV